MRCAQFLVRKYSLFLEKYYFIILILTPLILIVFAVLSFVPPIAPDFPDFSEPDKGVEARGTFTMKRIVTVEDTFAKAIESGELSCPSSGFNRRRKRSTTPQPLQLCHLNLEYFYGAKIVYEAEGADMMNADLIKATCRLNEQVLELDRYFVCQYNAYNSTQCCPSSSLGNYIAEFKKRESCQDITESDVASMKEFLLNCSSLHFSGELESQQRCVAESECLCLANRRLIKNVFTNLVDKEFARSSEVLKTTMILTPLSHFADYDYFRDIYERNLADSFPVRYQRVRLVAFDFPDFKFDEFNRKLLADAVFPVVGLVCIALILLVYTQSFFIMFMTVFSVISSVVMSYFVYHHVFQLKFFPFLNVVTFIFLVGIGADDAFVFSDTWDQVKRQSPAGSLADWMDYTLRHAALSTLVTSFTTSAAFYANVISDITAIRLFGIFAGTSILINYALMLTWFPAGLIALEKWKRRGAGKRPPESFMLSNTVGEKRTPRPVGDDGVGQSANSDDGDQDGDVNKNMDSGTRDGTRDGTPPGIQVTVESQGRLCGAYTSARSKCSRAFQRVFDEWIPKALALYPLWVFVLLALGIGMLCAITVSPRLQRPKSKDFQVFASSHPLEQYDLKYKKKFRTGDKGNNFEVYMFFGIKAEDNGDHLVPDDFGHVAYDTSFSIEPSKNQEWLVKLCSRIRNQTFFDSTARWSCFPEDFKETCSANGNELFPFSKSSLSNCFANKGWQFCYNYSYPAVLFDRSNVLKAIMITFPTNEPFTTEYDKVDRLWNDINSFTSEALLDAPEGLKNGWSITWLRFFALQKNLGTSTLSSLGLSLGISFVVILLTSLNWLISVYAIVTIAFILCTTVGSLVLAGWELNILESIVISVAVGLSVDFTLHYGVSYTLSSNHGRAEQVKFAFSHIGPAVTLASITTFIAGIFMMFSTVLVYYQLGQFLTLVMAVSWFYATFFFMSLCYFAGPVGFFGQINKLKCYSCKVAPSVASDEEDPR